MVDGKDNVVALIAVALAFVGGFSSSPEQVVLFGGAAVFLGIVALVLPLFGLRDDPALALGATTVGLLVVGCGIVLSGAVF